MHTFTPTNPAYGLIYQASAARPPFTSWNLCWYCICYQMRCLQDGQGDVWWKGIPPESRCESFLSILSYKHVQVHWKLQLAFSPIELNDLFAKFDPLVNDFDKSERSHIDGLVQRICHKCLEGCQGHLG